MLLVKTKIGPSPIAGIGLFADELILRGTPVWKYIRDLDLIILPDKVAELSESARKQFLNYSSFNPKTNKYVLDFDDARFMNHSEEPNIIWEYVSDPDEGGGVALRNIDPGEELTLDYRAFDKDFDYKMSH